MAVRKGISTSYQTAKLGSQALDNYKISSKLVQDCQEPLVKLAEQSLCGCQGMGN
jgi:hypothetical protein